MNITAADRQTLLDIALQQYGNAEAAMDLAIANDKSISQDISAGESITLPETLQNRRMVKYYDINSIMPATAISPSTIVNGGINYLGIEIDFIVS